ncbi:uncharacterized protein Eint_011020 [Encephalitozoon intestinalis ATCC 50506]|uniref:Uncharacterized protein n=1 Tax=Encephalitozoon intestinalis (strain ATCC 50506) TaxID=876142 RepID=E0S5H9_ENCIT|nr:uncharacterized protein Eint_011020 [Encephalitozoon intestinalis ATCC 50506]ADM10964.1 hypothetical protein Eint_011020 [Encephalitozoon intestinalis ATCC 50506]UTX44601.1 hypothetical protein GPK93_01g01110 [Encephalitozoon intestinalis]
MDVLSEDGDFGEVFDERVRIRKRRAFANITNRPEDEKLGGEKKAETQDTSKSLKGLGNEVRGKVIFRDFTEEPRKGLGEGRKEVESGEEKNSNMLLKIQKEFEELKEIHRKVLRDRRKLIRAMEKEVGELKRRIESKRKAEMESLENKYSRKLEEMREAYKKVAKEKILEYKKKLDEAYRVKASELREKYGTRKRIRSPRKKR